MPSSFNAGIATSARQVVGLHEPPRNTSTGADVSPFDNFRLQSSTLLRDFVLRNSVPVAVVAVHRVPLLASTRPLLSLFSCCRELNRFTLSQIDGEKVDVLLWFGKNLIFCLLNIFRCVNSPKAF